jgi:hypothetical protein
MRSGSGAFASVYRARQTALDRHVALKFIYEKNGTRRHGLLKEAQTQAKLRTGCVPQLFDAFEWRSSVCMVMEWVRGVSLARLLETPLSDNDRLSLADSFIRALAEIHRQGYAHRDLKPENILLSPDNGLFLVDFGFSKNVTDASISTAGTGKGAASMVGTPTYMAPELWSSGATVDFMRVDVFAAGKILLQVLDGTSSAGFAASCVMVNPQLRPSSGVALLALWENELVYPAESRTWKKLAGDHAAAELSAHLCTAAKELLDAHRSDEAYWLLVESIEENSTNHEAIGLLGSFQEHAGKKRKTVGYGTFFAALIAGIGLSFLIGLHSRSSPVTVRASAGRVGAYKLATSHRYGSLPGKAVLRHDSLETGKLYATIFIRNMPEGGHVVIDNDTVNSDTAVYKGTSVPPGSHAIVIRDSAGAPVRREIVGILPFQIKTVDAMVYRFSGKGPR